MTEFFGQVMAVINSFGGLTSLMKVSAIITILISSMKVSFFNDLIWSKLGAFQVFLAPVLGLAVGIVTMLADGSFSFAGLLTYLTVGVGAVAFHEILDLVKKIPGIGEVWINVITIIESLLGKKNG